jgi:hypothetical protein
MLAKTEKIDIRIKRKKYPNQKIQKKSTKIKINQKAEEAKEKTNTHRKNGGCKDQNPSPILENRD